MERSVKHWYHDEWKERQDAVAGKSAADSGVNPWSTQPTADDCQSADTWTRRQTTLTTFGDGPSTTPRRTAAVRDEAQTVDQTQTTDQTQTADESQTTDLVLSVRDQTQTADESQTMDLVLSVRDQTQTVDQTQTADEAQTTDLVLSVRDQTQTVDQTQTADKAQTTDLVLSVRDEAQTAAVRGDRRPCGSERWNAVSGSSSDGCFVVALNGEQSGAGEVTCRCATRALLVLDDDDDDDDDDVCDSRATSKNCDMTAPADQRRPCPRATPRPRACTDALQTTIYEAVPTAARLPSRR